MSHYILIKGPGDNARGVALSPAASALALLTAGYWPLWEHTRNRKAISAGASVAVYVTGTSQVLATAVVERVDQWTAAHRRAYPLMLGGTPAAVLVLGQVQVLEQPVNVKDRLKGLTFINQNSRKWGISFYGGTRAVSAKDFETLTQAVWKLDEEHADAL